MDQKSLKEERIRKVTHLYYSRPEVQKAIFEFSQNREVCPRYFEGFGKRPDFFQYTQDIFEFVKKGATSLHCSEELWDNPLNIKTGMNEKQLNELRIGWDLVIDIDSKYLDYSKILAEQIIKILNFHGVKNIGIKFSGSKGFHIIIPWKSFPKKINNVKTSDMFPEWPRAVLNYITERTNPLLIKEITKLTTENKYVLDFESAKKVIPDIILVSPRHLFRMPYSLHEKTSLASVVLTIKELKNFQPKDADPMKVKIRDFIPKVEEGEATELLIQALDWSKDHKKKVEEKRIDFKPVKLENLSDKNFPPSIQKILQGLIDGRKRALFILINLFRSIGMEKAELEKRISEWNKKNKISLKQGYIESQISWSYRNKIVPPPNFDKDYYKGIGIIPNDEEMRYKNPLNYVVKKSFKQSNTKIRNFKNKD